MNYILYSFRLCPYSVLHRASSAQVLLDGFVARKAAGDEQYLLIKMTSWSPTDQQPRILSLNMSLMPCALLFPLLSDMWVKGVKSPPVWHRPL